MAELKISVTEFKDGDWIPNECSARGVDKSPEIHLAGINENAISIAITLDDSSHPLFPNYNHWVIWNLPVTNIEGAKQVWGSVDGSSVYINKTALCRIMDEAGFDFEAVKTKWQEKGYLERTSRGRYSFSKSISGVKTDYVKISQSSLDEDIEPNDELPFND